MKIEGTKRKYFLYLALTILLDGFLFLFHDAVGYISKFAGILSTLVALFWLYQITKTSGLFRTMLGRLLYIAFAILMTGALAKLEHWWWASYALILGICSAAFIYLLRFLLKKNKNVQDIVKLLFFQLTLFLALSKLEHYNVDYFEIVKLGIYYLMIYLFVIESTSPKFEVEKFSFEKNDNMSNS